ncbi:MAG: acyl-CoA dehydrogenase family protein [Deltaproteobacteria bacterium]|nr:acyl-CoA dehydrogenase family protein [Deltaproteobacteria bacterium]
MTLDLAWNSEQQAIADAVAKVCRDRATRAAIEATDGRFPRELWSALAELGFLALGTPEGGAGALEIVATCEALGAALFRGRSPRRSSPPTSSTARIGTRSRPASSWSRWASRRSCRGRRWPIGSCSQRAGPCGSASRPARSSRSRASAVSRGAGCGWNRSERCCRFRMAG